MIRRMDRAKQEQAELIAAAIAARESAYAPYSSFKVGAAVLGASGKIYGGCNVENVSLGLTICAERIAIGSAIAGGEKKIAAVAVVAGNADFVRPCGACLQVMAEFSEQDDPMAVISGTLGGSMELRSLLDYLPIQFVFEQGGQV